MLKERQQKEAAKTYGDSYLPFSSDKTVYAVQHPGSVNFIWKSSLCKFTFAMIITPIIPISYVKPLWCPHRYLGIWAWGNISHQLSALVLFRNTFMILCPSNGKYITLAWQCWYLIFCDYLSFKVKQ